MELDRREIKKLVMLKYPVTKGEMDCANERAMMKRVRDNYRKKLIEQLKEKSER